MMPEKLEAGKRTTTEMFAALWADIAAGKADERRVRQYSFELQRKNDYVDEDRMVFEANCERWLESLLAVHEELSEDLHALADGRLNYEELTSFGKRFHQVLVELTGLDFRAHMSMKNLFSSMVVKLDQKIQDKHAYAGAASMLAHDIAGIEMSALVKFSNPKRILSMDDFEMDGLDNASHAAIEADWAALTRIALLKMAGVFMVSINRLGGETSIEPRSFDLSALCDHVSKSIIFRFRTLEKVALGLEIDLDVEPGTKTEMLGREALIYLVIMNILKNAPKIMAERETPEEKQKIKIQLFERESVLFFHYEDEAGGIDITRLLAASVRTIQNRTQAGAREQLSPTLKVIRGGAFQAAEQLTLQSICDLIFEQYITARQGGSGLGLHEAKDLLAEHGAYIQATPTLRNGTQFLIAFPQDEVQPGDLQRIIHEVKMELDQKEATTLRLLG